MQLGWLLNLDAELELADPLGHRASPGLKRRITDQAAAFLAGARRTATADLVHLPLAAAQDDALALAWCPTPSALAALAAQPRCWVPGPAVGILRAVNHRRFAARLSAGIPGACFADDASTALAHIESRTPPAGWLLKRPFGFSGRARKRLRSPLTAAERRWITASMAGYGGGLQIEPFVQVCAEYALHGFIEPSGPTLRGAVIGQECAADGAWLRHGAAAADPAHINALHRSFEVVVTALREVGYFGPFCIDALVYRDGEGRVQLQPLGEINARFTMGYFTGMASQLPALTAALRRLAAAPPPRDQGR